jgi:serine/threonine protein kinase
MARSTLEDFVVRDKLGSGSYGTVYKVVRKLDRQTYALKEIVLNGMSRKVCMRAQAVSARPALADMRPWALPSTGAGGVHSGNAGAVPTGQRAHHQVL